MKKSKTNYEDESKGGVYFIYRISSYSCRGNYSFLGVGVRQLFKGGNYSKEETIDFYFFFSNLTFIRMSKHTLVSCNSTQAD